MVSNVLQPRGPLPARVYWVRRLLLLLVVVTITSVLWVLVAPGGDGRETAGGPPPAGGETSDQPTATTPAPTTTPGPDANTGKKSGGAKQGSGGNDDGSDTQHEDNQHGKQQGPRDRTPGGQQPTTSAPLPQPTGPCDPAQVEVDIEVEDAVAGEANTATLQFTSLATPACTLGITPDSLEIQVTSGSDVLWSSTDCPANLPARQVVARVDPPAAYAFTWSGHRSSQGCGEPGSAAVPGGYWVEASLIGGEPAEGYFDLT
jgi:hypothetical protein